MSLWSQRWLKWDGFDNDFPEEVGLSRPGQRGDMGRQDELCGAQGQSLSWESGGAGEKVRVLH